MHSQLILVAKGTSIKSYFEHKKRDLSNTSNNKEEREKKARESSLYLSLRKETNGDTDLFTKGMESPSCTSILYDCLRNLQSKVNEIYQLSSSTKDAQI